MKDESIFIEIMHLCQCNYTFIYAGYYCLNIDRNHTRGAYSQKLNLISRKALACFSHINKYIVSQEVNSDIIRHTLNKSQTFVNLSEANVTEYSNQTQAIFTLLKISIKLAR